MWSKVTACSPRKIRHSGSMLKIICREKNRYFWRGFLLSWALASWLKQLKLEVLRSCASNFRFIWSCSLYRDWFDHCLIEVSSWDPTNGLSACQNKKHWNKALDFQLFTAYKLVYNTRRLINNNTVVSDYRRLSNSILI